MEKNAEIDIFNLRKCQFRRFFSPSSKFEGFFESEIRNLTSLISDSKKCSKKPQIIRVSKIFRPRFKCSRSPISDAQKSAQKSLKLFGFRKFLGLVLGLQISDFRNLGLKVWSLFEGSRLNTVGGAFRAWTRHPMFSPWSLKKGLLLGLVRFLTWDTQV